MGRIIGILIGGGLGMYLGYLILPDLAFLIFVIGAVIGAIIANRGRKVTHDSDGEWYDGQEGGGDDTE